MNAWGERRFRKTAVESNIGVPRVYDMGPLL